MVEGEEEMEEEGGKQLACSTPGGRISSGVSVRRAPRRSFCRARSGEIRSGRLGEKRRGRARLGEVGRGRARPGEVRSTRLQRDEAEARLCDEGERRRGRRELRERRLVGHRRERRRRRERGCAVELEGSVVAEGVGGGGELLGRAQAEPQQQPAAVGVEADLPGRWSEMRRGAVEMQRGAARGRGTSQSISCSGGPPSHRPSSSHSPPAARIATRRSCSAPACAAIARSERSSARPAPPLVAKA